MHICTLFHTRILGRNARAAYRFLDAIAAEPAMQLSMRIANAMCAELQASDYWPQSGRWRRFCARLALPTSLSRPRLLLFRPTWWLHEVPLSLLHFIAIALGVTV